MIIAGQPCPQQSIPSFLLGHFGLGCQHRFVIVIKPSHPFTPWGWQRPSAVQDKMQMDSLHSLETEI